MNKSEQIHTLHNNDNSVSLAEDANLASSTPANERYVGRFAPSPSGPLHFGSLVCALASFLHARQQNGKWLLRIEDIDTPRVDPHMSPVITNSLQQHGIMWDDEIVYQSERHDLYKNALGKLSEQGLLYACACSRKQIRMRNEVSGKTVYDNHCRNAGLAIDGHALRFKHLTDHTTFKDLLWNQLNVKHPMGREDPVLKRADGIFAYHLAVVADDIEQGVNHIVRGYDLYETTPVHLSLFLALSARPPHYLHVPVIVQKSGQKLSKQHHSPAIDDSKALDNIRLALEYLGLKRSEQPNINKIEALLNWAIEHWRANLMTKQSELLISTANGVYSAP